MPDVSSTGCRANHALIFMSLRSRQNTLQLLSFLCPFKCQHRQVLPPSCLFSLCVCCLANCIHSHGLTHRLHALSHSHSVHPPPQCQVTFLTASWAPPASCLMCPVLPCHSLRYLCASPHLPELHLGWSHDWCWPTECGQKRRVLLLAGVFSTW